MWLERARRHPDDAYAWLMAHREINGQPPLHIPALEHIARDRHPRVVVQKSAQIGLTELAVNLALHAADTLCGGRGNVLYLMPTRDQVEDFAQSRFDAAIQDSAYLRSRLQPEPPRRKGADSMRQKLLGRGRIFLRSCESTRQVASIDADRVIIDEFDETREGTLERAEKRLASSRDPSLLILSTPRLPESGINAMFLASDQRYYFIRCPACDEEQALEWPESVDFERARVACRTCRGPMNVLAKGRWIATHSENTPVHGYHLNRLYSPWANIPAMIEASQATTPLALQEFYNSDLGLPFVPPGGGLDLNALDACRGDYVQADYAGEPCVMGVDVGLKLHVVIRETQPRKRRSDRTAERFVARLWFAGEVDWAELDALMEKYNVKTAVFDLQPERHKALEFAKGSRRDVLVADYNRSEPGHEVLKGHPPAVRANRVDLMDQVAQRFRDRDVALPRDARHVGGRYKDGFGELYRQLMAPQRVPIKDGQGNLDYRWRDGGRDDHYFHAEVYALLAERVSRRNLIEAAW